MSTKLHTKIYEQLSTEWYYTVIESPPEIVKFYSLGQLLI